MSRQSAIARAVGEFDDGTYLDFLGRAVAVPTESQNPERLPDLHRYLKEIVGPYLEAMGHRCRIFDNTVKGGGPILVAERIEDPALPTVLGYGHGDVIRGLDEQWQAGLAPWRLETRGDRLYGRGTADNKGQHVLNLVAQNAVLKTRGRLGFNSKWLIETGEENGSAGLPEMIKANIDLLSADAFIASDGPRIRADQPTVYLGSRGAKNFDLLVELRAGGHHSGNWGGLLANPAVILAHALSTIVTSKGQIRIKEWLPPPMTNAVRSALADVTVDGGESGPAIDADWGEPGLVPAQRVYGWNSFEVLAMKVGNPEKPVNAIPPRAWAHCQIRFVQGSRPDEFMPALRRHLDAHGFSAVQITPPPPGNAINFVASRTEPDHPWALWAAAAMDRASSKKTAVIPNFGGSICNDLFNITLGLPSIWIPHSYPSCSQHAPNEHVLLSELREAMGIMAGIYWDLGEPGTPAARRKGAAVKRL